MPKVPQLAEQVDIAPIPGVRLTAAPTAETFGAGIKQTIDQVGLAVYTRAVREEDDAAIQHAATNLNKAAIDTQLLVEKLRGKEALGGTELVEKEWEKHQKTALNSLNSDRQRKEVTHLAQTRYLHLYQFAQEHGFKEHNAYKDQEDHAFLQTSMATVRLNPDNPLIIEQEKVYQAQLVANWSARNGVAGTEVESSRKAATLSKTNTEVVTGLLMKGMGMKAKAYYEANKNHFTHEDRDKVEKQVVEGSYREESRRLVNDWVNRGLSQKKMLELNTETEDSVLADHIATRIHYHFTEQDDAKKRDQDALYQEGAWRVDDARPDLYGKPITDVIPERVWLGLEAAERHALKARWEERQKPTDRPNDNKLWLDFLNLTPEQTARLSRREFETKYWSHFDNRVREKAETYWHAAKDALAKKEVPNPQITTLVDHSKMIMNTLMLSNLVNPDRKKWTKSEELIAVRFEQTAQAELQQYELEVLGGKRKASPLEVQKILDKVKDVAIKEIYVGRRFASDKTVVFDLSEDEKGRAYVPEDKISRADWLHIWNFIRSFGKTPDRDKIQRIAGQYVLNNRLAAERIAQE